MADKIKLTVTDIVAAIADTSVRVIGDPARHVVRAVALKDASADALTFSRRRGTELSSDLARLSGATIICHDDPVLAENNLAGLTVIATNNPRLAFMRAVDRRFSLPKKRAGIHPSAVIDPSAVVHPEASVGAHCVVGQDCFVGAGTVLHPHVVLYDNVKIGERVVVHGGTVIGADGFGYERNENGELEKFPHIGGVVIESDVEIGSNTSIDRGALADTIIRAGAKIDNQVHISHNVVVGEAAVVIAQSMIGGSVVLGDHSWVAPSACIMNQRSVGSRATIGLQALVVKDVEAGSVVMGSPAVDQREFQRLRAKLRLLSEAD